MARRIGQERDNLEHLKERARPARGDNYGQWFRPMAAFMKEVDAEAIDFSAKLRKVIEPCLLRSPVELILPVSHQGLEIIQVRPIIPASPLNLIGPSGTC